MKWTNPGPHLGILPSFLSEDDPRPAKQQIHSRYAHGGGWKSFKGFTLKQTDGLAGLDYPGDRPMQELSRTQLREETIILFESSWVAVVAGNGDYEIARID